MCGWRHVPVSRGTVAAWTGGASPCAVGEAACRPRRGGALQGPAVAGGAANGTVFQQPQARHGGHRATSRSCRPSAFPSYPWRRVSPDHPSPTGCSGLLRRGWCLRGRRRSVAGRRGHLRREPATQQRRAGDGCQRPLVPRSRCPPRLTPSVRPCGRKTNPQDTGGGTLRSQPGPSKTVEPPRQTIPRQEHLKTENIQDREDPRQPAQEGLCRTARGWRGGGGGRGGSGRVRSPRRGLTKHWSRPRQWSLLPMRQSVHGAAAHRRR